MTLRWTLAKLYTRVAITGRGGFALARKARLDFPRDQWRQPFTALPGVRLELDLATYPDVCMALGIYELETRRWIQRLLKPGGHFVDCGANLGFFTLVAARAVGSTGRVDAVEPDPINADRLSHHLRLNGVNNVTVHRAAVAAEPKSLTLYHPTGDLNHGQASGFAALVPGGTPFEVPADRLDRLIDAVPDLVKIDIEGAELDALRGGDRWWTSANPPAVIFEHNPDSAAAAGFKPSDLLRRLQAVQPRYRFFKIDWRLKRIIDPADLDSEPRQQNVLARPDGAVLPQS